MSAPEGAAPRPLPMAAGVAVAVGWAGIVIVAAMWGRLVPTVHLHLGTAPPFIGRLRDPPRTWSLLPAVVGAAVVASGGPAVARRLAWRPLLAVAWIATAAWAVALAASDGWNRLAEPLTRRFEYLAVLPRIHGIGSFIRHFTAELPTYPTHVKGHGPLAVVPFWLLDRIGLPMPAAAAALVIAVGSLGTVAVAGTVRRLIDEAAARRVLPFLVLLPAALWIATSADAMFYGVSAIGVALLARAGARRGWSSDTAAAGAGVFVAAALLMSYGLLVLLVLPLAVALMQRRWRPLLVSVLAGLAVIGVLALLGFSYIDGFRATHAAWAAGWGPQRSRSYFLFADLGCLAVLIGPAVAIALPSMRRRAAVTVVIAVGIAIAVSDASGFVRGEAERIWLPFAPWLAVAVADAPWSRRGTTLALLSQAAIAVAVQAIVRSPW